MPAYKGGYLPYDLAVQVAYIGDDWTEEQFISKMSELFYKNPPFIDSQLGVGSAEGKLYFSNQGTSYIMATIVSGIDFAQLYRYKTTTVTWHCQPYRRKLLTAQADIDKIISFTMTSDSTWSNTDYITDCTKPNRRPRFWLQINAAGMFRPAYLDFTYACWPDSSSYSNYDRFKEYCVGRQYIIDIQAIANSFSTTISILFENGFCIDMDTENEIYRCYLNNAESVTGYRAWRDIIHCINQKTSYPGDIGYPQDAIYEQGITSTDVSLTNVDYSINRRLSCGNTSNSTPDQVYTCFYDSNGQVLSSTIGTCTYYPNVNII